MPKSQPAGKERRMAKKRKKARANPVEESLANVCNITGLDDGAMDLGGASSGVTGGDEMDCLAEMASAQVGATTNNADSSKEEKANSPEKNANSSLAANSQRSRLPSPPRPPGIGQIPNLRIELARHLRTQNLSIFLQKSCPGVRMPTFERWLLDSKLEETDRLQSIIEGWMDDPSSKLAYAKGKSKKKYGRAAMYDKQSGDARQERDNARKKLDCDLLLSAERRFSAHGDQFRPRYVGSWIRQVDRDPVLPYQAVESDASCERLLTELTAVMAANSGGEMDQEGHREKAAEMVRELCDRTTEACKELGSMEQRLGKCQKFGWETASDGGNAKKKRKRDSGSGRHNVDRIAIEWNESDTSNSALCSLVYTPKKKSSRASSTAIDTNNADEDHKDNNAARQHKPKPFVIKINGCHYNKLRALYDATYSDAGPSLTKEQITHAFHAAVFALVIRYSSLSGGQQLNDWRGGGMQGAVHEGVFDCLSKWLGAASGTECFASPLNCTLGRYFSAFPSPDIDGHFGSHGDFFNPPAGSGFLQAGWCELNPPFSPGIMKKMANRIKALLDGAHQRELDVTFVVVIPTVLDDRSRVASDKTATKKKKKKHKHAADGGDPKEATAFSLTSTVHGAASQSFRQLIDSPNCKRHIILPAREHGYLEGGQHLRPTKYKESQSSTSVIVLRSNGSMTVDDSELFESEIREAFASRHAMEVKQRKEKSNKMMSKE